MKVRSTVLINQQLCNVVQKSRRPSSKGQPVFRYMRHFARVQSSNQVPYAAKISDKRSILQNYVVTATESSHETEDNRLYVELQRVPSPVPPVFKRRGTAHPRSDQNSDEEQVQGREGRYQIRCAAL